MSSLSERVAALSPEKRALLERHLRAKRPDTVPDRISRRGPDQAPPPLSFPQQRLWFLEQLEPGHSFYNLPLATRLTGPIRVSVLEESLNEIIRRHEALRTTFAAVEGQPAQIIAPGLRVTLPVTDLGHLPEAEREAEAAKLARVEADRAFDLARGPLFRAVLLRLSDVDHVLLLTMHHIVSDGWSMSVLLRELSALYAAYSSGRQSPLAELPVQYADFAVWQRGWLKGKVYEELLAYWRGALAGMPPVLELPTDRPRQRTQVFNGAAYSMTLPKALLDRLKVIGRQADATLFMTLLAGFDVLLQRYSGRDDVVVGTPIANRTRVELEGLIGFFVNTLVLRTDLSGDPTFRELMGRVRRVTLEAYAHQDMPFERLVEELQPERNLAHNPLFQVAFVLQNTETGAQIDPRNSAPQLSVGTSKFDLTLCAMEATDGLIVVFEYNTSLFDDPTIVSMARNFETLLESVAADPERRVSELLLLSPEERQRLIVEFNQTAVPDARASLIHELCEEQAALHPESLAITFGERRLTYRELNARANQLARHLRERGVGPEVLVGLCVERTPEMLVGLLGILKAGGAYVPLDPAYPKERLEYMLKDTSAPLLLTQQRLVAALPEYAGEVICLDADWERVAAYPDEDLEPQAAADNLAYVIYTSGSTGKPKGVMIPHSSVCNVAVSQARAFEVEAGSRVLQLTSLSFDASVFEIVMTMRSGATLCLMPREATLPGMPLVKVLRDERINVLVIPPTALAELPVVALPELRTVVAAAEACSAELVARWSPGRRFINAYGPTEATIWATCAECRDGRVTPPIGRPVSNTQAYILDARMEPVPIGVPGEIYLGGAGLAARGYLGRPDLTAERYIPDPFLGERGARLYRTGDWARRLPGGEIQFLGRVDSQVKLRGYRIELGEIEAALLLHPAVREASVVVLPLASGDARLAACYVAAVGESADAAMLRDFLRGRLPDYMVPAVLVQLDSFPRTPSGKLDRHALTALAGEASEGRLGGQAAPRNATEETLAGIWREVLEVERVGIHDDFFDLGGHSLLATRVMSRANEAFEIDLPLRQIFELPTIALLSEAVESSRAEGTTRRAPSIMPIARATAALADDEVESLVETLLAEGDKNG